MSESGNTNPAPSPMSRNTTEMSKGQVSCVLTFALAVMAPLLLMGVVNLAERITGEPSFLFHALPGDSGPGWHRAVVRNVTGVAIDLNDAVQDEKSSCYDHPSTRLEPGETKELFICYADFYTEQQWKARRRNKVPVLAYTTNGALVFNRTFSQGELEDTGWQLDIVTQRKEP